MSDTPRTEAALKASRNQFDVLQKLTAEAAKLERENAALKQILEVTAPRKCQHKPKDCCAMAGEIIVLGHQNAALLEAMKNIAMLTANGDAERANWVALGILNDPRAAIDAARKEEQP